MYVCLSVRLTDCMLPRNKRREKQQSTGRRNARATGRQREGQGEEVGRKGISRKLKNTHCVRSMWMMSPPFHLVYLIPPLLATTKRDHLVPPAGNRQRRKGCIRTHTHTHTHTYTRTHTHACCVFIGGGGRELSALWKLHPAASYSKLLRTRDIHKYSLQSQK